MCVVSMIGDGYQDQLPWRWPSIVPALPAQPAGGAPFTLGAPLDLSKYATKEDIEKLREEITELKKVLTQAAEFDKKTGQPGCETPDKLRLILLLAEALGVDMAAFKPVAVPT